MDLLVQHGSDAVRYWAASGRLGTDTAFDVGQIKIGRRLAIKILNASKFVLGLGDVPEGTAVTEPLDQSMLAALAATVREATAAFEAYDHTRALERTERFFWDLCDDYLELVKARAYGSTGAEGSSPDAAGPSLPGGTAGEAPDQGALSARAALRLALSVVLRLFAPILPYVTEEVWSWWQEGSVHRAAWPDADELPSAGDPAVLAATADVLRQVRKAKSTAKVSMRAGVDRAVVRGDVDRLSVADLRAAGRITDLVLEPAAREGFSVDVTLAS
jgi:valyl-tRNA synthetase